jgi:hypothetical protein
MTPGPRARTVAASPTSKEASMTSTALRRNVAGFALAAAALFKLASVLLWPRQGSTTVELHSAAAHPAAWTAASFLWLAFVACMGAGTLGMAAMVPRGRGAALVQGGAAVVLLSMLAWGAMGVLAVQEVVLAQRPDRAATIALVTDMKHSGAMFAYVLLVMLGQLSLVAVFAGLRRARQVPVWVPLAMVGAIVLDFAGDTTILGVLESALLFAAFGTVGLRVLGGRATTGAPAATALAEPLPA